MLDRIDTNTSPTVIPALSRDPEAKKHSLPCCFLGSGSTRLCRLAGMTEQGKIYFFTAGVGSLTLPSRTRRLVPPR